MCVDCDVARFLPEIIRCVVANEEPPFRPVVPSACKQELLSLMKQCWETDPDKRPHFSKIIDRLKKVMGR